MAILIAQQLNQYYETFKETEVAFTKEIIKTLALDPRQIYIKCAEGQWPCIINSLSFSQAKIIISTQSGAYKLLASANAPAMSLRLCFYKPDGQLLSFFITCKKKIIKPYASGKDLVVVCFEYTQRPPDDLIERMGHLIEANTNAMRRKEERIPINAESCRRLGIPKEECIVLIQSVPRRCILRDISFAGVKIVVLGVAKFLQNKEVQLSLEFDEPHEVLQLKGTIVNTTPVEGRADMVVANIMYDEKTVSMSYKIHINNYLTTTKMSELDASAGAGTN